jgi:polysaccharide biosynthesis protein PslH
VVVVENHKPQTLKANDRGILASKVTSPASYGKMEVCSASRATTLLTPCFALRSIIYMKILWVKAGGLVPLDLGGRIRSYQILKELARRHQITLFTFYAEQAEDPHPALKEAFERVECLPLKMPAPRSLAEALRYGRNLFSLTPYTMSKFCRPEVRKRLRRLLEEERYDVIICDFLFAAGVIPWQIPCPKVLFTHNVEAVIWKRQYEVARNPLWKLMCWREYRSVERSERRYLNRADQVLTVSEVDRTYFARLIDPARIAVIPTGVDVEYFQPALVPEQPGLLVFTGAMDWMPNEDGVLYFVNEVLPRIRAEFPNVTLRLVGRSPSARIRALAERGNGVQVTGRVEDIRPFVHDAEVYVVPLRIGGGTRLKIFEAMAMGKAVVSTPIGAEGLPVEHGENILLADGAEEFATSVVGLLKDSASRHALGEKARRMVLENYRWESAVARFETVLTSLFARTPEPRPS